MWGLVLHGNQQIYVTENNNNWPLGIELEQQASLELAATPTPDQQEATMSF